MRKGLATRRNTCILGVRDTVDGASEFRGLDGLDELSGLGVEALDAAVFAIGHADQVLVLGESEAVRDVEAVGAWKTMNTIC